MLVVVACGGTHTRIYIHTHQVQYVCTYIAIAELSMPAERDSRPYVNVVQLIIIIIYIIVKRVGLDLQSSILYIDIHDHQYKLYICILYNTTITYIHIYTAATSNLHHWSTCMTHACTSWYILHIFIT